MSAARKNQVDLSAIIGSELEHSDDTRGDPQASQPAPDLAQEQTQQQPAQRARRRSRRATPAAEDLVAPKPQQMWRRPLNVDVPEDLNLHRRMHQCRLEQGVDIRDQAALAIDAWLRERGF